MQTVATHVKVIDKQNPTVTHLMHIHDAVKNVAGDPQIIRYNLEKFGVYMSDEMIVTVIKGPESFRDILNRSTLFYLPGETLLVKPNGIGFMGVITGIDDEGMNVVIDMRDIIFYRIMGGDRK